MAIDPGDRRIGIAVSDPSRTLAQPLCVLHWGNRQLPDRDSVVREIARLCEEHEVSELVVGLARNMDGSLGPRAEEGMRWRDLLEKAVSIPVHLQDERLTTRMAEDILISGDVSRKKRRNTVDKTAAALILQTYLSRLGDG